MGNKISFSDLNDIPIDKWLGLYSRGKTTTCPKGYFPDCLNTIFDEGEVSTRGGSELDFTKSNIVRYFRYRRIGEASRYLVLDSSGNFFDSLTPNTPLITNVLYLDFSAVNYQNRAYITFHNRTTGISSSYLFVYEGGGPGTLRQAAGVAPSAFTLSVTTSGTSGNIEAGIHLFAIAFESSTGFISQPGPAIFAEYTAPGGYAVNFSAIPVGPTGTTARWILGTKAVSESVYDGNQFGQELFFAVRIGNNTATTYTALSFYDADLLDSADYLYDNLTQISSGLGLLVYNDRLITWGMSGDQYTVRVSKQYYPENFNDISGFLQIEPSGTGVQNCVEYRKQLYIAQNPGLKVTVASDGEPNTWGVDDVDPGVGTTCFGFAKILGKNASNTDRMFIADKLGLIVFESGTLQKPELTWSIKAIWERINLTYFNKVQVCNDPENSKVYITIPLDDATSISHILVGDYSVAVGRYGFLVPQLVKWSLWQFPWTVSSIELDYDDAGHVVLTNSGTTGGIYIMTQDGPLNDDGTRIQSYIKTYFSNLLDNYVHEFIELALRVTGAGSLEFTLYNTDDSASSVQSTLTLSAAPGRDYLKLINFTNERMSVKIGLTTTINNYFTLEYLIIRAVPTWYTRPA